MTVIISPGKNKKALTKFIIDLCAFSLEQAGYEAESYAFYLHIAFRHQSILQDKKWKAICEEVEEEGLDWQKPELLNKVKDFAQSIATEVSEASQDNWAVKLIKTSYLSRLDRARKSSEQAIRLINAKEGQEISDTSVSLIVPSNEVAEQYTKALKAHIAYLDCLLSLPFELEKLCLALARNKGINYQPRKTAEMLASMLDTLGKGLDQSLGESAARKALISGLNLALQIAMPDLPIDSTMLETLPGSLSFIDKLIDNTGKVEEAKGAILPESGSECAKARKALLAAMDVHFESVQDILSQTLLKPAEDFSNAFSQVIQLAGAAYSIGQRSNPVDGLTDVAQAFAHFDRIAVLAEHEEYSQYLPSWVRQANTYYAQLKKGAATADGVVQTFWAGLGAFYKYTVSFMPAAVSHYFSRSDDLSCVLEKVDDTKVGNLKSLMVYFAFYELVKQGKIKDPIIKHKFFEAYVREVIKAGEGGFRIEDFRYSSYESLERQLQGKPFLDPRQDLSSRITSFGQLPSSSEGGPSANSSAMTNSLVETLDDNDISLAKLDMLLLVNRLQTLESEFDPRSPAAIFSELAAAKKVIDEQGNASHEAFGRRFLQMAMQRLLVRYQEERLIPLLEEMLDAKKADLEPHQRQLRTLYSKLKERAHWTWDDWREFKEYWQKYGAFTDAECKDVEKIIVALNFLKVSEQSPQKRWKTPKESMVEQADNALKTAVPAVNELLDLLQKKLNEQRKSCGPLEELVDAGSEIEQLCKDKIAYIDALNGMIYKLKADLNNDDSTIRKTLVRLLNEDQPKLVKDALLEQASLPKLLRFAWNVLPATSAGTQPLDETFIGNLLHYYLKDTPLAEVKGKAEAYEQRLNHHPVPALMKELSDPLGLANLMPAQEQMMDAIVAKLLEEGNKTLVSWGSNYLKAVVSKITRDTLLKLLPYPFLADLALQVITSERVQAQVAPLFNALMNEYGGSVKSVSEELKEAAKNALYPLLGIEVQKTIEAGAYRYAIDPNNASDAERDTFAMYYLQYREIRRNGNEGKFTPEKAIALLFPGLLPGLSAKLSLGEEVELEEKELEIISKIKAKFTEFDAYLRQPSAEEEAKDALAETNAQLEFLIANIDVEDHKTVVRAVLLSRLLIQSMETAEQLHDENKINDIQRQTIENLSAALEKINKEKEENEENEENEEESDMDLSFVLMNSSAAMLQALAGANQRAETMQLKRLNSRLKQTEKMIEDGIARRKEMLDVKEPMLGISLAEWEYRQSKTSRKLFKAFSFVFEAAGFVSVWASIITPLVIGGGVLQVALAALGISAAATGFGAAALGALALLRFGYKLTVEIWNRRREFQELGKLPLGQRILSGSLLVLKCVGLAAVKTIFTDYLVARVSTLLAFGPIARIRNALGVWPSRQTVESEKQQLEGLNNELSALGQLLKEQIEWIEKKEGAVDQTKAILAKSESIQSKIDETYQRLNAVRGTNDARLSKEKYKETLDAYKGKFKDLKSEIKLLERLKKAQGQRAGLPEDSSEQEQVEAQKTLPMEELAAEVPAASKPVIVDLKAYQSGLAAQQAGEETQQLGVLSRFWQWFRPSAEAPSVSATVSHSLPVCEEKKPVVKIMDTDFDMLASYCPLGKEDEVNYLLSSCGFVLIDKHSPEDASDKTSSLASVSALSFLSGKNAENDKEVAPVVTVGSLDNFS